MMLRLALRSVAVLIAIAALIDPAWSSSRPIAKELIAINMSANQAPQDALRSAAAGWDVTERSVTGGRIPCGPDERCALFADGSIDAEIPADAAAPVSLIPMRSDATANIAVRSVSVNSGHVTSAGVASVALARTGSITTTTVQVRDGAAIVGSASHWWAQEQAATIEVAWLPIDAGARTLRIEAVPVDGEATTIDNAVDVGVVVGSSRAPVLFFDARPSWAGAFVRRAIEDEKRFTVEYRSRLAPALTTGTVNGRLDTRALDRAAAVIISGPDALTAADVTLLDQYVRVRGGSLILLPERRDAGEAARFFDGAWTEHLSAKPERVGALQASETLRAAGLSAAATVLAREGTFPSIVSTPAGNGRVIVSGAMDAWRYRDLDAGPSTGLRASGFDRFWQSLVAEAARAGEAAQLTFDRALVASASRARFTIRDRRMQPSSAIDASAVSRCDDGAATTIRLWPSGTLGEFAGEVPATGSSHCVVEATIGDRIVNGAIAVMQQPKRGVDATLASLEQRVRASGGTTATAGDLSALVSALNAGAPTMSPVVTMHPMRAWWWMLPFAACLSVEWWLRRRTGLR